MFKATQRGFTLIELVVVIVILGILAAFALPRFMGLETQARIASLRALEGSLRSSSALAHSVWLANGGGANIQIEGQNIAMAFGYPTRASIDDTLQPGTIQAGTPGRFNYVAGAGRFELNGSTTPANCSIVYTAAAAANTAPTIAQPVTNGC